MSRTSLKQLAPSGAAHGQAVMWDSVSAKWVPNAVGVSTIAGSVGSNPNANAITFSSGGASFNGTTSKIVTGTLFKPSTWSMNCWINPAATQTDTWGAAWYVGGAGAPNGAYWIRTAASPTAWTLWNGSTSSVTATIPVSTWSMTTITYDGAYARAYTNGVLVSGPTAQTINAASGTWFLGDISAAGTSYSYQGLMDEVGMWDRELTQAEITALYNSGNGLETMTGTLLDGLAHQWHLNGNSVDIGAGNGAGNAVTYTTPKLGSACAAFNGTTSKIQTAVNGPLGAAAWSVSTWVYFITATNYQDVISWGTGANGTTAALERDSSGTLRITNYAVAGIGAVVASNAWHHIVATYNGTTATFYLDNGTPVSGAMSFNTGSGVIKLGTGPANYFTNGKIDDTCMWDRALTAGEVASLYNAGTGIETMTGSLLTGLLHQWHLNGSSVDSVDGSGNGTDTAVLYGGKLGQAAMFNGTTSKIVTAIDGPLGASPRSISCWININESGNSGIVSYGTNSSTNLFSISVAGGTSVRLYTGYVDIITMAGAVSQGAWYHLVATYDGTTTKLYVNAGTPGTSTATINTTAGQTINIGFDPLYGYLQGLIDDVAIWNRALTASEVTALYNSGAGTEIMSGSLAAGLIHQWHLNASAINSIVSSTTNTDTAVTYTTGKFTDAILSLEPASALYPGIVTAADQAFSGSKTFNSTIVLNVNGLIVQSGTDSSGTPGNATIDKPTGVSAIASGATTCIITNSLATTASRIIITWYGDHGATRSWVTRAAGSFTVSLSSAATAHTSFGWEISSLI
jgi:Concanavalin A-like lectin/glucanases superfamily